MRVYWKGAPPANLTAAARTTVPVKVLPAAHSKRELEAAADKLLSLAGGQITQVGPRADGAGLLVGTSGAAVPAADYAGVPVTMRTDVACACQHRFTETHPPTPVSAFTCLRFVNLDAATDRWAGATTCREPGTRRRASPAAAAVPPKIGSGRAGRS